MIDIQLDQTDRRILSVLQIDGRTSNADLAERINLSASACHRRVQRLDSISKNVSSTSTMFRPKSIGFFHPFTSDGGGGERVLWQFVKLMREKYPTARVVIYTGDKCDDGKRKKLVKDISLMQQKQFSRKKLVKDFPLTLQ